MMATEAADEKPVDVSVNEALLAPISATTETSPHHVANPAVPLNGGGLPDDIEKNKQIADIVDELVNSAEVSVSGGSDTEASTSKLAKSSLGHARASSTVKKPQSFKSVSVNKTFLGAKNAAHATSRSETSSPSLTPAAPVTSTGSSASKLKLVAKSGSSLGGSSKTLTTNGKAASAPDPNSVWNRNRPAPPPEPKKLSDEELVSKYGIHLADRLRPEDDRGQSNWADIDDDDEWAPDTITWTDGTKITLPQVDESASAPNPPRQPSPQPPPQAPVKVPTSLEKPKSPAPSVTTPAARASPSVKPGVLASGKGLVLKGAPEKPQLVAKAPAPPTPVKSPWATLPPIDRASPVLMEQPNQQLPYARGQPPRDALLVRSATPPPAKEIAADDFTRAPWRDGHAAGSRELYNSQSGRYEPVQDRRGSRHDPTHRQPALLQRPSQHEQLGPAEPSPAFQTSRTSGYDSIPYGRRRTSSNVSGGSGSLAVRLGRPHDMPPPEGLPSVVNISGGQASPGRPQPVQPWQSRPSPGQGHAVPQLPQYPLQDVPPAATPAAGPSEDDIELQKRLMRERREMAIKRRLEEEAREEAAKKERIRLKLEAMGPAPERKSARKEELKETPYNRDGPPVGVFSNEDLAAADAERTKPPTSSSPNQESTPNKADTDVNGTQSGGKHPEKHQPEPVRSGPTSGSQATSTPWPDTTRQTPDRLASWGSGAQSASRNVWGAPGNDRSLGNGTFNSDLVHLADSQPTQPASISSKPTPIGPPRSASQGQPQRADQPSSRLAPIGPPNSRSGASHTQAAARRNPWAAADITASDRAIRAEKQKHMDEYRKTIESQGLNPNEVHHTIRDTWRGVEVGPDGKRLATEGMTTVHAEHRERLSGPSWNASAPSAASHDPPRSDNHQSMQSTSGPTDYRQHQGPEKLYARPNPMGVASNAASGPSVSQQPRAASRFFPQAGPRDLRQDEGAIQPRSKSPTPPPPTMDGHPAYDGDVERPHVSLPPTRPVVRLPPPATRPTGHKQTPPAPIAPPKPARPISFAAAVAATQPTMPSTSVFPPSRGVNHGGIIQKPHEIAKQENWQEKINSLVRNPVAPIRPVSVDSSSKSAFDAHANISATVSLPSLSPTGTSSSENCAVVSKEMAEECFDEQEMGSLPPVNLPADAPHALWPARAAEVNWHPLQVKHRVDAASSDQVRFPYEIMNHKSMYRICTPGMDEAKMIPAPFGPRNRSNPKRQGRGGRHVSRGGQRGGRESGDQANASSSDRSDRTPSTRGRGGFRARSENWSRSSPLAQATPS